MQLIFYPLIYFQEIVIDKIISPKIYSVCYTQNKKENKWNLGKPHSFYNPHGFIEDDQDPKENLET